MSIIAHKPLPVFAVLHPDGSKSTIPALPTLVGLMDLYHVVEFPCEGEVMRMYHRDCRKQGAAPNQVATKILSLPDVVQVKGQRRKMAYGDAYLMAMRPYPCVRAEMSASDLKQAIATCLPDAQTYESIVDHDVWDVFFLDPAITDNTLVQAAIVLG